MPKTNDRENARLVLQADLDRARTQTERNRLGQFATPPRLADEIVRAAIAILPQSSALRFLDPGFGTGSFYSALLKQVPSRMIKAARGFEIDPHYGEPAKALWEETGLHLELADFTKADAPAGERDRFNLVICNPPYVRHHHLSPQHKQHLRLMLNKQCGFDMNGLSGLYCYFLALSKAWMTPDGVAAWLIPSEFMDVNYGFKVKEFLLEQLTLLRIHRFDSAEVQFDDALVSSAVLFFRNTAPVAGATVDFSYGGTVLAPRLTESIPAAQLRDIAKWSALPEKIRLEADRGDGYTLADFFSIKRGLATGCNSFFVIAKEDVARHAIPGEFLTPILPSPRDLDADEIEAEANGNPSIQKQRFLISCNLPETVIKAKHPIFFKYLESGKAAGVDQRYLCAHRDPWYCQEDRPASPFLCTYMGRPSSKSVAPFRFILNHSKATAANVYLMLYPRPLVANVMKQHPEATNLIWEALRDITGDTLTDEGRIYGGGLHKIEPKELAKVPAHAVAAVLQRYRDGIRQKTMFARTGM